MKESIRSFIAIDLSTEIYKRLDEILSELKRSLPSVPVRWVAARNIHLTLKFLGEVSPQNLGAIREVIQRQADSFASFEFQVKDLGVFPTVQRPRVIWVGVTAPEELVALQRGIENDLARLGYPKEDRAFSPHLTLGRVGRECGPADSRMIAALLQQYHPGFLGTTQVRQISIYRSELKPGGSVYTPLFIAQLQSK